MKILVYNRIIHTVSYSTNVEDLGHIQVITNYQQLITVINCICILKTLGCPFHLVGLAPTKIKTKSHNKILTNTLCSLIFGSNLQIVVKCKLDNMIDKCTVFADEADSYISNWEMSRR
jgi:hypothetical protein